MATTYMNALTEKQLVQRPPRRMHHRRRQLIQPQVGYIPSKQHPYKIYSTPLFTCMAQCTTAQTWTIGCGKSMSGTAVPAGSKCTRIATVTINPTQSIMSSLAGDEGYIVPYWRSIDDGKIHLCSRHYYYIRILKPLVWTAVIAATVSAVVYRNEIQDSASAKNIANWYNSLWTPCNPDGSDGSDGSVEADGSDGSDGTDGTDGSDGSDGTDGTDGSDGSTTCIGSVRGCKRGKKLTEEERRKLFEKRLDPKAELRASKEAEKIIQNDPFVQAANAGQDIFSLESEHGYDKTEQTLKSQSTPGYKKRKQRRREKRAARATAERGGEPRKQRHKNKKQLDGGSRSNRELYIRRSINKKRMDVYRL